MATGRLVHIDPLALHAEVEGKGVSVICGTCQHYWNARERGIPGTGCMGRAGCGSPMAGDAFFDYDGPFTEEHMAQHCFVCNHPSVYGMVVVGKKRIIGVCEAHLDLVVSREVVAPLRVVAEIPDKVVLVRAGMCISLRDFRNKPRKKRFIDFVREAEKEFFPDTGDSSA